MEGLPSFRVDEQRDAFERYVLPETEVLLRVALSLTRRPADAEDLVQDTLIRAYRCLLYTSPSPRDRS